jgi:translocation and assembly module TamB
MRNLLVGIVAVVLLWTAAVVWYVHTDSFQRMVRARLVSALESITGGRVELAKLSIVPFRFRVEAHNLTIHGTEPAGELPYAHVDRLTAEIKIISLFQRQYGFHALILDHPVVHIIVAPDGSTNQPTPRLTHKVERSPVQQLFDLSISHLQVAHGELLWNNERIPLQISANDISAQLNYSLLQRNYEALLRLHGARTEIRQLPPFLSNLAARVTLGQNYVVVNSFEWNTGNSRVEANGRLDNFQHPQLAASYNGRFDISDIARISGRSEMRSGILELGGNGTWAAQDFFTSGKAAFKSLDFRDGQLFLRSLSGSASYAISSSALKISDIQARVLGGTASGTLNVVNWLNPQTSRIKRGAGDEQKGSLALKLKDISIAALTSALRTRRVPLNRVAFGGLVGGTTETQWVGSLNSSETSFNLAAVSPPQSRPGEIAVAGNRSRQPFDAAAG